MGELGPEASRRQGWKQDPDGVRRDIILAATRIFAEKGFDATRIDDIASQTETSKRMIYYYFTDKMGLYEQVLTAAYERVGKGEAAFIDDTLPPVEALRRLIGFLWDHHRQHPDFVRLVMNENLHNASTLRASKEIGSMRPKAVSGLAGIYQRGVEAGHFRPGVDPLKLRFFLSALGFFNVSNRDSFTAIFGDRLYSDEEQANLRQMLIDTLLGYLMTPSQDTALTAAAEVQPEKADAINPDLVKFLKVWDEKWSSLPRNASAADRRKRFEVIAAEMRLPSPDDVDGTAEHWVESSAGPVRVRVFRHKSDSIQPVLIYMHGGAWMQGSPETHWDITSRIASWNQQTVISVDYAKAPEQPFPAGLNQCRAVVDWAIANAAKLRINPDQLCVGGDSAGGNLAAALSLMLRDDRVQIKGQLLIYPACDFDTSRPSYSENYNGPLLQVSGMAKVNAMYCPRPEDLTHPLAAPLHAKSHAHLAPAMICTAQFDPLRDSGLAYADTLEAAGTPVSRDAGPGLIHGYLRSMEYCPDALARLQRMAKWLHHQNKR